MSDWQPIKTAPKDAAVLLWSPDAREHGVMIGFWCDGCWCDYWPDTAPEIDAYPTHWMPVPEPPDASP